MSFAAVAKYLMAFYVLMLIVFGQTAGREKFANLAAVGFMGMFMLARILRREVTFYFPAEFKAFFLFAYLATASWIWSDYADIARLSTFLLVLVLGFCVMHVIADTGDLKFVEIPLYLGQIYSLVSISIGMYEFQFGRTGGPLGHPNLLGYFIVIVTAFCVRRLIILDTTPIKLAWLARIGVYIVIIAGLYQLFIFSGSRRGMIICFFSLGFYIYKFSSSKEIPTGKKLSFLVPIIIAVSYGLNWLLNSPFFQRLVNLVAFASGKQVDEGSVGERSHMIQTAFELWQSKPILGWGVDAFKSVGGFGVYSHNNFLEILSNNGLLGFSFFYAAYGLLVVRIIKIRKHLTTGDVLWLVLCFLAMLMADAGGVNYYSKLFWLIFSAMVGLCLYNTNQAKSKAIT